MEGFDLPIGGDLSELQAAFDAIIAAIEGMGDKIVAALERSNAAASAAAGGMAKMQAGCTAAAAAQNAAASAAASASQKFMAAANTAGMLGHAAAGVVGGLQALNSVCKAVAGVNLAAKLSGWVTSMGGIRAALTSIPARLGALASNPAFRKLAVGAVAAAVAIGGTVLAVRGMRAAFGAITGLAERAFRGIAAGARRAGAAIKGMFTGMMGGGGGLLSPLTSLAGALGVGGALFLAVSQFKGAWNAAADFEQLRVRIEQFTGSAEKAQAVLGEMATFAVKTPFELPDINQALSQLMGAGITDGVTSIVKELGAVSRDGQQLTELADALAKGFAKGKFQTEELNKFLERGINLMPQFAEVTGLAGDALTKAVEKGLRFDDVREAIARMSREGGQFYKMLERQSMTAHGMVSTLVDVWNELRRVFMQPMIDAIKPVILDITRNLEAMIPKAEELGKKMGQSIIRAFALIKSGKTMELLQAGAEVAFLMAVDRLQRGLRGAVAFLATALPPIFDAAFAKMSDLTFWEGIANLLKSVGSAIAADIRSALGQEELAKSLKSKSDSQVMLGKLQIERSGQSTDFGAILAKGLTEGFEAARKAMQGQESMDLTMAHFKLNTLMGSVGKEIQRYLDAVTVPPPVPGARAQSSSPAEAVSKAVAPAVMSLTRIGGGGNGMASIQASLQRQGNNLLAKIVRNTTPQPSRQPTAVYA